MKDIYGEFFETMESMRKIRVGDLFTDMTKAEAKTLLKIQHFNKSRTENITVSELAETMNAKPSAVSRTLRVLEEKGLIARTVNPSDRRNTYVVVTEQGEQNCKEMTNTMSEFAQAVLAKMDETELRQLITYIKKLNKVASEEIELRKKNREE